MTVPTTAAEGTFDLIVIGSGIAGLTAALTAAPARVALVTKGALEDGCSRWAQGGIAAALGDDDSAQQHFDDTIAAGRGLCNPAAVRVLAEEGPARVRQLIDWGVTFDTQDGRLQLGREAAHSKPRIVHARGDGTGLEVETSLSRRVRESHVTVIEQAHATGLLLNDVGRCHGVAMAGTTTGSTFRLGAGAVILASGGAGRLWRNTTNPEQATGDGVALAYEAGAEVSGMEFVQFHPTALAVEGAPRFLISETLRGEGAVIVNEQGRRFVLDVDARGELAGRDLVARAIWEELRRSGASHVYLDCRPIGSRAAVRFPAIHRTCTEYGIELSRDLVPIAPAAHYMIGGVRTELDGATSIAGLYACGEVASSGVHGANRLASNSLLESLVFARRAALAAMASLGEQPPPGGVARAAMAGPVASSASLPSQWAQLNDALWEGAGVVRDAVGLRTAGSVCADVAARCEGDPSLQAAQLRAAATTASLVCQAALAREESRGCQLRSDFPQNSDQWHGDLVMQQERGAHLDHHV
jgi:L-aspartate oxidase